MLNCVSERDGEAAFVILQDNKDGNVAVTDVSFLRCTGKNTPVGLKIVSENPSAEMAGNRAENCTFLQTKHAVYTEGTMRSLTLSQNKADSGEVVFLAEIKDFKNIDNSWNAVVSNSGNIKNND